MIYHDEGEDEIMGEQISLILGQNYVISFQEREGDVFNAIRDRIRNGKGRIRKAGADYLAYALIDAIVDQYFLVLEKFGEKIESLEEELVTNPTPETAQLIHKLKRDLIFLRKSVWPLREVISSLERGESSLIVEPTGNRMNEVMKVLTIIATIFIPLTFIAGIYGMNFKFMPELEWHWGYPTALMIMLIVVGFMVMYFRRKKWL
jgi:magnesium transporter